MRPLAFIALTAAALSLPGVPRADEVPDPPPASETPPPAETDLRAEIEAAKAEAGDALRNAERSAKRAEDAAAQAETLRGRLAAAEQSIAALRDQASMQTREMGAAQRERDDAVRRLEQMHARLASATQATAASDSELATLVRQSRDDAARVRGLEAELAALKKALARAEEARAEPPPVVVDTGGPPDATFREYQAALETRTRENLALKTRIGQMETQISELTRAGDPAQLRAALAEAMASRDGGSRHGADTPALDAAERKRVNDLFEEEKKTLLLIQNTTEEHLDVARTERDAALQDVRRAQKRIAELEKALAKRESLEAEILTLGSDLDAARKEAREAHNRASSIARDKANTSRDIERLRENLERSEREIADLRDQLKAARETAQPPNL